MSEVASLLHCLSSIDKVSGMRGKQASLVEMQGEDMWHFKDWKVTNVTLIFKKGNRGEPGNYRLVSLTSVLGKLVISVIKDRIRR